MKCTLAPIVKPDYTIAEFTDYVNNTEAMRKHKSRVRVVTIKGRGKYTVLIAFFNGNMHNDHPQYVEVDVKYDVLNQVIAVIPDEILWDDATHKQEIVVS